ncbi:molybdopterin-dependent oxidoreductase [Bacillus canaveralius]|uniref:molybdopterin-dependent oxidoreductase n=1 Tax=Bacillus canaveralius TaxID=1403243 RepID=UPI000F777E62|nr:molybdopterin-dependent oxidoreductase [Bacillus canaveralius]RSK54654.1 dehydrogenase [Bacillus canaveralius]
METSIYRNTCPRNCFGTCSILSYVENGKLIKVSGDPKHGYTQGRLCAKGYAYTQYVYNPSRLKYPILQMPRGSGNWQRISWDQAYTIIAEKLLELYNRYGSNLAAGYNKFSGNLGMLHYAVEGMFNGIGPHTKPIGNICASSGLQAVKASFGHVVSPNPEHMAGAKLIVIWGANPAATNIHQMKFIFQAKQKGAKIVVIDPILTETAVKADLYIQIKPGTDALLALGIAKLLIQRSCSEDFSPGNTIGWKKFKNYVMTRIALDSVCRETGIKLEAIEELARLYATIKPAATWSGLGMQRNENGRDSIQAINSLVAMTGNLDIPNGGAYFMHDDIDDFPLALSNHPEKKHPYVEASRCINNIDFALSANNLDDPPLKFLWIASRSPFSQDLNIKDWEELFKRLELIVTVDLYMTKTAKYSDLVLPAASHFEEDDLHVSYWHHWLSINQKAISPYFEAKSDLQIARELTRKLNELSPGFSTFPAELEPVDWINKELTPDIKDLYSLNSYEDLLAAPHFRKKDYEVPAKKERFYFYSPDLESNLFSRPSEYQSDEDCSYPFRLLSPQSLLKIHSQYESLTWLNPEPEETIVEINDEAAFEKGIKEGTFVSVYNKYGSVKAKATLNPYLPIGIVRVNQTSDNSINQLIVNHLPAVRSQSSSNFYDSHVDVMRWDETYE